LEKQGVYMNRSKRRALAGITQKRPFLPPQTNRSIAVPVPVMEPVAAPASTPEPKPEISAARLAANRTNALASTGPRPENYHKVSQNALKHGLTGRAVLLQSEDGDQYQAAVEGFAAQFEPVGIVETYHVQALVDIAWRLNRIPALESGLLAAGRLRLSQANPKEVAATDPIELELKIREDSERAFRNLQLQEHRLHRRYEKELKELRELQASRQANQAAETERTKETAKSAKPDGIVFSNDQIIEFLNKLTPEARENLLRENLLKELASKREPTAEPMQKKGGTFRTAVRLAPEQAL